MKTEEITALAEKLEKAERWLGGVEPRFPIIDAKAPMLAAATALRSLLAEREAMRAARLSNECMKAILLALLDAIETPSDGMLSAIGDVIFEPFEASAAHSAMIQQLRKEVSDGAD